MTPLPRIEPPVSDRQTLIELLAGDGPAFSPTTYDRFEAWWYGAAANSRRAFAADMRAWGCFRRGRGQPMIPAGAIDVRDFARAQVHAGLKASSIARQLASIAILHDLAGLPSPTRDRVVSGEMKGIRREEGLDGRGRRRQALPLRLKGEVGDIVADKPLPLSVMALSTTLDTTTAAGARDAVLLLLGTDLGRRRSEYAAMNVGDVTAAGDGSGTMLIRRSKTDQSGEGRVKYLSPEAMVAIRTWLASRQGDEESPLPPDTPLLASVDRFGRVGGRLSDDGIRDVLLRIARRGLRRLQPELEDAAIENQVRGLSGHSLRVGFAQDLTAAGEGLAAICQAADWSSPTMPTRYAEALAARSGAVVSQVVV
ncbi:integrase [Polymorphobacter multimanifer]|uniref:Integrase n=1 Tax=Polymorphobacter multimanifer TaxID=1070431 RepID=A0A841LHG5_9SPHN|nr:tyrosine-type recombinase/integrase [Polymorphobacter multimanifer]MBB6228642.1 integrase [Polymorphobacter multimanifer]GGI68990.1 integrase [Polymorphobacter multimanifer]